MVPTERRKTIRSVLLSCVSRTMLKLVYICLILHVDPSNSALSDVTSDVFGESQSIMAAFGDFNADKATDIFALSSDGKSLFILEADIDIRHDGTKFSHNVFIQGATNDSAIINVVPGDFDRDSQMDVLVMRKTGNEEPARIKVEIYKWNGNVGELYLTVTETFRDQPIVMDHDGDMSPDLFGETDKGQRAFLSFHPNGSYSITYDTEKQAPLKIPQSSAFVDLNGDLSADLCAVSVMENVITFEFWINHDGKFMLNGTVSAPEQLKVVGQASFVDLDGNHGINIVLPGCLDDNCKEGAVFVWAYHKTVDQKMEGNWHKLNVNFNVGGTRTMSFPENVSLTNWLTLPMMLRTGDFNLDGYPDALAVVYDINGSSANTSSFLFYNKECGGNCQNFSRTLVADFSQPLQKNMPAMASFFDLMENGVLDILITEVRNGEPFLRAVEQEFSGDASFLKVMVVSGLCEQSCDNGHSPYGVNQVGPAAKFESTTPLGNDQVGQASQLTQSTYFSLQLPFMLFGLGQTPNFVDKLEVGIPQPISQKPRKHAWPTLIPNSQVIVIPYPPENSAKWKLELYVTPSRLVLLTGASLLGTCAFIAVIVGLLQWRERVEDKKEKLQEAQRFHFDAM